ncbi:MAG TPA: hypothetical protein VKT31_13170 [Solirubrobacteraceae bacterium]|nr:hypothetical protein [Solirubrobacteraceae bacterium]
MSAPTDSRAINPLSPGLPVSLNLDGEQLALDCVIASVEGQTATLVGTSQVEPKLIDRLQHGRPGYLLISDSGTVIGLRGAATVTPETPHLIEFVVTDA